MSNGRPYKRYIYHNYKFSIWMLICIVISLLILLVPVQWNIFQVDDVNELPQQWRYIILLFGILSFITSSIYELYISPKCGQLYKKYRYRYSVLGSVYGRRKPIDGTKAKLYHKLRGEFEAQFDLLAEHRDEGVEQSEVEMSRLEPL